MKKILSSKHETLLESTCAICYQHIMKDIESQNKRWFHTPNPDRAQPTGHDAEPIDSFDSKKTK
jgi:hypothetical protein